MAQQTKSTLKNWFMTGLKPIQQHFHDWMDSYWHKSESIPQSVITDLESDLSQLFNNENVNNLIISVYGETVVLNDGQTIELDEGQILDKVVIESGILQVVKIESQAGLEDVVPLTSFEANELKLIRCDYIAPEGGSTLTVTCDTSITCKIWIV